MNGHDVTEGAHLDGAPLNLFANVRRESALWGTDNDVVGFPQYPIVAVTRLSPTGARPGHG